MPSGMPRLATAATSVFTCTLTTAGVTCSTIAEKSAGAGGVDPDRIGEGDVAVGDESPGAGGADDPEGEDAGEQRIADAPGSRGRMWRRSSWLLRNSRWIERGPPRRSGADRRSAPAALGGECTACADR